MAITLRGPKRISFAWLKPPKAPADGSMTLFEHIKELRYRLVVSALAIVIGMALSGIFYKQLFALLRAPYDAGVAELKANNPDAVTTLVNIGITEPFTLALKITLVSGLVLTSPIWLYQLWSFIVPALLAKEKKWALIFIGLASPLFLAGVAVGYWIMPKGVSVLLSFTAAGVTNLQNINTFLSFLLRVMIVFGIAFLLPLVVLMLNFVGVVSGKQLGKARVYVIFGTFVFGAVATPSTDPFSMLALAIPMTLLFLGAEMIARLNDRRRARRMTSADGKLQLHDKALNQLEGRADDAGTT